MNNEQAVAYLKNKNSGENRNTQNVAFTADTNSGRMNSQQVYNLLKGRVEAQKERDYISYVQRRNAEKQREYEEYNELKDYDLRAAATELHNLQLHYDLSDDDTQRQKLSTQIANKQQKFDKAKQLQEQLKLQEDSQRIDNMSSDEILKHLDNSQSNAQKKVLVSKRQELQEQLGKTSTKGVGATKRRELQSQIRVIETQLRNLESTSGIAYTTQDGKNVTWESLYETKKAQEEFDKLYNELSSKDDWEEKSKYINTTDGQINELLVKQKDLKNTLNKTSSKGVGASKRRELQSQINEMEGQIKSLLEYKKVNVDNGGISKDAVYGRQVNDQEKQIFNYLYKTQGLEAAMKWHKSREGIYKQRAEAELIEAAKQVAEDYPVLSDIGAMGLSLLSGFESVGDTLSGNVGDTNFLAKVSSTIKNTRMEQIDWEVGDWDVFDFLYSTTTSGIESFASMAFGPVGAGFVMGLSASAQATNDALERGMSKGQAFVSGLASGTFEGIFEAWQIGAFSDLTKELKKTNVKSIAKYIGKNMWNNAKEETLTEIANIVYDTIINGDFSQCETSIRQYMNNGLSESEAKKKVALQMGAQVAQAGASGALMGFGFGAMGSAGAVYNNISEGKSFKKSGQYAKNSDVPLNTNAVTKPIESYPVEKQSSIKSFVNSVDENIKSFVQRVKSGDLSVHRQKISDVSARAAADIKKLLGIDTQGYTHNINTNGIQHILKRHGVNGQHDTTMSSDDDIARVGWVLENYDSVEILTKDGQQVYSSEFIDSDGKPAAQIMFTKKINGTYYVVEAAFENERNKLWVQSTYLTKNKEDVTQTAYANNDRDTNARSASASPSSNNTVPRNTGIVNNNISQNGGDNSENSDLQSTAKGISEPDISKDTRSHAEQVYELSSGKENEKAAARNFVQRIGKALGVKVVFEDTVQKRGYWSDGYIDEKGTIHIDYDNENPITFIFRHELVHYGRISPIYERFGKLVRGSKIFEQWLLEKSEMPEGTSVPRMEAWYKTQVEKSRPNENLSDSELTEEMIADFVGSEAFKKGGSGLAAMSTEVTAKEHNVVLQYIIDFISWIKKKINKVQGADKLTFELSRIEDSFNRMISDAKQNPTERKLKHSIAKNAVAKNSKTRYNEYATSVMSWAYSASTKTGDVKIFNDRGKEFVLNEATEDGYVEISRGSYEEVFGLYEQMQREADNSFYGYAQQIRSQQGRSMRAEQYGDKFRGNGIENSRYTGSQKLQINTSGNAEGVRSSDKGKQSNDLAQAELENSAFSIPENIRRSVPINSAKNGKGVDTYTETQYNNFGWASYNKIITPAERETLLSRYADYKHNKDIYPTTRFGEAVIHSTECPSVIIYVKGPIRSPQITKVVRFNVDDYTASIIKEMILQNEYQQISLPYSFVEDLYGQEVFSINYKRDCASFQEYIAEQKRGNSQAGDFVSGGEQDRARGTRENTDYDRAELEDSAFSMPEKIRRSVPIDTSYMSFETLTEKYNQGKISQEDYMRRVAELYDEKVTEHGALKKGEKGKTKYKDIPVPSSVDGRSRVERYVRTVLEGGELTDEMTGSLKAEILDGNFNYKPTSNDKNLAYAEEAINKGTALGIWERAMASEKLPNATEIAIGEMLLKLAIDRGNTAEVVRYTAELAEIGTRLGQSVQALSLLKRMDGVAQLVYIKRSVDTINHDLQKRFGAKAQIVEIDENMAMRLAKAKTQEDFQITYSAIMNDIAAQVPATFLDKWNAWRYMAMLFNPTTHIRNLSGNGIFVPGIKIKNTLAALGEKAFLSEDKRTKSLVVKKEYKEFAAKDFEKVVDAITGNGKMNPKTSLAQDKPIFKTKWLEKARKFNFDLLEKEDMVFLQLHYKNALAGYLQAQKVDIDNISEEKLMDAREYATLEAQKATYRDANALANMIQRFSDNTAKGGKSAILNLAVEGVLPFKKTPMNIVRRGIEYSPIGIIKTLTKGAYDLKKGNITASQFIDGIAGGLTGTGIMLVGMALSSLGIAVGGFDDEDEDWFRKLNGEQEYAIRIGNTSYTIDWAAPVCIPFFIGVAIQEMNSAEGNENLFANIGELALAGIEPIINLSMLSGIQDTISAARYADADEIVYKVAGNVVGSYFSQALPTVFGKVSNTLDDTRRSNYIDKSSAVPVWLQSAWNTLRAKTPILSKTRAEYINAWGEVQGNGNFVKRFFQNFLSPGYLSTINEEQISKEISRLAKATGEAAVIPDNAPKYVKFKSITKHLSAEEYANYATVRGQKSADYIAEAISNAKYSNLTDGEKAEVIKGIYEYCNAYAKSTIVYSYEEVNAMYNGEISKTKYSSFSNKAKQQLVQDYFLDKYSKAFITEKNGGSIVEYFIKKATK